MTPTYPLAAFGSVPTGIPGTPVPFTLHIPGHDLYRLPRLAHIADIGVPSWYSNKADTANGFLGITRDWLVNATDIWINDFDWRAHEKYQNSFPNYRINVSLPSDGELFDLHFAALFSERPDATPIIFMHGWPGSWTEFTPMMDLLVEKYTPETLPYHVIVPSLPDYGLSYRPGEMEKEVNMTTASEALNQLMVDLGFDAYIAQGGDVGYFLARTMCGTFDECKAFHLNMFFLTEGESAAVSNMTVTPEEETQLAIAKTWGLTGSGYAYQHGTHPSTIALALMTSPVAMLAWMGEKFIEWSDNRNPSYCLSVDTILAQVSFYWYTNSYARSLWAYRSLTAVVGAPLPAMPFSTTKPFGYSWFPVELSSLPHSWGEFLFPNLVFYRQHERGGHFAALQEPVGFLRDIEDFVAVVKKTVSF